MMGATCMRKVNGATNPRFFAVTVGLEEIETFVAVIVMSVQAVHGCFGCLCTWTLMGSNLVVERGAREKGEDVLGKL